jgi:SAM-dependent methyltransferase
MAKIDWLSNAFSFGYDSGDILAPVPSSTRLRQEVLIGGCYRETFRKAILPFLRPDSTVLELGPGRGSWTRAILRHIPQGRLEAIDFVDVSEWLKSDMRDGRLHVHRASDFSFSCVPDATFDFFWSFGVLCHHTIEQIQEILKNARTKMKPGAVACHEYGDWGKFFSSGRVVSFPGLADKPDEEHWWPSNNARAMSAAAEAAGWTVLFPDLGLFERDGLIVLKAW